MGGSGNKGNGQVKGKDPLIGTVLADDFRIVQKIGFGGYARVYLAEQLSVGRRKVAVKVLHSMHVKKGSKAAVAALKREASYLAMLGSSVFPRILRSGISPGGLPFFVMEFVGGRTLDQVLKDEKVLPTERVVTILDAVCDGISEMHGRDIIHRDLKTGNIGLEETVPGCWKVRLLDLGTAKPVYEGEAASFKTSDIRPGSPPYLAPETVTSGVTNEATDIYSLGAVGYEMLCGIRALHIKDTSPQAFIAYLKSDNPIPIYRIATIQPEVPEQVEDVVTRALSRNPGDRFSSAWEFRSALHKAAEDIMGPGIFDTNSTAGVPTPERGVPGASATIGIGSGIANALSWLKGRLGVPGRGREQSDGQEGSDGADEVPGRRPD